MLLVLAKSYSVHRALELESSNSWPEEAGGVRVDKDLQGIEEACKGLRFPDLGFISGQSVISKSCHHLF